MEKFCQSCGMPMDQDPEKGGTNKDGTKNDMYCSYCYENGEFKDDFTEASQMVEFVKGKLAEKGMGKIKQSLYTSQIKKLKRWK
ncbi:Putative zinc ribbon domain-containing protein [Dethiosulfatibacter aminovorans DSM 17477]|uniref:Putative zinc ribbon domain-containing protein n=1 Tax=Dethiosulfatibacter aminovorans DSM 17477 TaxID=1121476 RepID=A0A1M6CDN8_9FIRM|nr:zinc ribbon domain-containing protein [Dethiosulfatibacter aminovorans]SHI59132.1 Putative zinc ribbon domain-containing protein [Dethiosulfatibacter aminovorans DSM 17477]